MMSLIEGDASDGIITVPSPQKMGFVDGGGDEDEVMMEEPGTGREELPPTLVNPRGHCIICLKKMVTMTEAGDIIGEVQHQLDDDEGGVVPIGRLPLEITTLRHIWTYLIEDKKKAAQLKQVKFVGGGAGGDDVVVSEVPPMCRPCLEEVVKLDRLHRELMQKIEDIKMIIKETGQGGAHYWRREGLGELLRRSSHLEPGMIRNTLQFLDLLAGTGTAAVDWIEEGDDGAPRDPLRETETGADPIMDTDWKLRADAAIIPLKRWMEPDYNNCSPSIIPPDNQVNDNRVVQVKRKRGRPKRNNAKAASENLEGSSCVTDPPGIKQEVLLEEEGFISGADYGSSVDCEDEEAEVKAEVKVDDDDNGSPTKPSRRVGPKKRRRPKRITPKKTPKKALEGMSWYKSACDICAEKVPLPELYEHLRSHIGDFAMKCPNPQCFYASSNGKTLVKNHLSHERKKVCLAAWEESGGQICETCGFTPAKGESFRAHLNLHETATKNVPCPFPDCPESFTVRQSVNVHIYQKHRGVKSSQQCSICKRVLNVNQMEGHLKGQHGIQEDSVIKCRQCPFVFPDWEGYLAHARSHQQDGVPCYICTSGVKFLLPRDLRKHYFQQHQIGKQVVCEYCGWECLTKDSLSGHIKSKHDGGYTPKLKKTFKCDLCKDDPRLYLREEQLLAHNIRKHGAEPFACQVCAKTFSFSKQLNRHDREEHAVERGVAVKPKKTQFPCDAVVEGGGGCTEVFRNSGALWAHKRRCHGAVNPKVGRLICEFCSKEFFRPEELRKHRKIHLGTREEREQHMCEECGEAFTSIYALDSHKMIHSGERPFSCHLCGQGFRQKVVLEAHLKSHETKGEEFRPKGPIERKKRFKREPKSQQSTP